MLPPYAPEDMLVEGLMLTASALETHASECPFYNLAPMGPIVTPGFARFTFRPFKTSSTYKNLKATGEGVFHITDDAAMIARAAISKIPFESVQTQPATRIQGRIITGACRAYELKVDSIDDHQDRTTIVAHPVHVERLRDFWGFNRARHAVLEAAILATRLHLTGPEPVLSEYAKLQIAVDKTGAQAEHDAMAMLRRHVEEWKNTKLV
jgi:uncharacterized protein